MNGRNSRTDFPVQIDALAIAEIVELSEQSLSIKTVQELVDAGAPHNDIQATMIIIALQRYLEDRNVDSAFEVVFDEA